MESKLIMSNVLTLTKNLCDILMHATIEAQENSKVFKNSLNSFLELQEDIYEVMLEHGWYQVEQVTEDKLSQARNKYCN